MSTTEQRKQNERRRARRGAYFKQKLEGLHVTHGEFTDLINKKIKNQSYRLSDSKKISDWTATGIPGPKTPMKARMRQLAIIDVLKIKRNSDDHKMLDGRMTIPTGHLHIEIVDGASADAPMPPLSTATLAIHEEMPLSDGPTSMEEGPYPAEEASAPRQNTGLYISIITITLIFIFGAIGIGYSLQSPNVQNLVEQGADKATSPSLHKFIQCPKENTYRSSPSTAAISVELVNKLKDTPRLVAIWIDFQGKHIAHLEIADKPVQLRTYAGHGWLFKNEKGKCYSEPFFASSQSHQYILR